MHTSDFNHTRKKETGNIHTGVTIDKNQTSILLNFVDCRRIGQILSINFRHLRIVFVVTETVNVNCSQEVVNPLKKIHLVRVAVKEYGIDGGKSRQAKRRGDPKWSRHGGDDHGPCLKMCHECIGTLSEKGVHHDEVKGLIQ